MSENAGPGDEVVHAMISADPVAATSGDGSEAPPEAPFEDPYDVPNPDEDEPDPGPAPDYVPDFVAGVAQDDGADPDAE